MVQTTPAEGRLLMQLQELKDSMAAMANENARLRVERDIARAQMRSLLPSATPEQEAEFKKQLETEPLQDGEVVLKRIIGMLERSHG